MTIDLTPLRRRVGRPSLPPEERLLRKRASKRAWRERNSEYVKRQLAEIQGRPESRARRAELDKLRWLAFKAAGGASRLVKTEAKSRDERRVRSSEQIIFSGEGKTPITTN